MPQSDIPPIFLLSCARSGSTLLRLLLDGHPKLASPPELHLLELGKRLLWTHRFTCIIEQTPSAADSAWEEPILQTRKTLDTIMSGYLARREKEAWCEKSITSLHHLDVLSEVYPDAIVICLYRQCLDVAASALEAIESSSRGFDFDQHLAFHRGDARIALVEYWHDRTSTMLEFQQAGHDRCIVLRYEDLVTAPQRSLEALAGALGLDWKDEYTSKALTQPGHIGPGDGKAYGKTRIEPLSVGRGSRLNWNGVPRSLLKKVASLQLKLGYPDRGTALN